jgi:nucleoside-diphosphate-sugar epimerase
VILITGANGIVGSALVKKLKSENIQFLSVVRRKAVDEDKNFLELDLSGDIQPIRKYLAKIKCIVHLAAVIPHSINVLDDQRLLMLNQQIDKNIHQFQIESDAHLIYMSTCGLYGKFSSETKFEDSDLFATSAYFQSKLNGESLFSQNNKTSVLRLAAPLGTVMKEKLVFAKFLKTAMDGGVIEIWGSGNREQNFIDVDDVADAILRVLNRPIFGTFNVAHSTPTTMKELAHKIVGAVGRGRVQFVGKVDPRDLERSDYSIKKMFDTYRWKPQFSIDETISRILKNHKFSL